MTIEELPEAVTREEQYLEYIAEHISGGGGGGTNNYNALINRPKINGHTLEGDKSFEDLGLESLTSEQIQTLKRMLG